MKLAVARNVDQIVDMDSTGGLLADLFTPNTFGGVRAGRTQQLADAADEPAGFSVAHPGTQAGIGAMLGGTLGGAAGAVGGLGPVGGSLTALAGGLGGGAIAGLLRRRRMRQILDTAGHAEAMGRLKPRQPRFSSLATVFAPQRGAHRTGQAEAYRELSLGQHTPPATVASRNTAYTARELLNRLVPTAPAGLGVALMHGWHENAAARRHAQSTADQVKGREDARREDAEKNAAAVKEVHPVSRLMPAADARHDGVWVPGHQYQGRRMKRVKQQKRAAGDGTMLHMQQYTPQMPRRDLTEAEQAAVAEGEQRWLPRIWESYGTPLPEMLASPAKTGLLQGLLGGGMGAALGGHFGARGALAGGLLGAIPMAVGGYFGRGARNEGLKEMMRRLPENAVRRDLLSDPAYQRDRDIAGGLGGGGNRQLSDIGGWLRDLEQQRALYDGLGSKQGASRKRAASRGELLLAALSGAGVGAAGGAMLGARSARQNQAANVDAQAAGRRKWRNRLLMLAAGGAGAAGLTHLAKQAAGGRGQGIANLLRRAAGGAAGYGLPAAAGTTAAMGDAFVGGPLVGDQGHLWDTSQGAGHNVENVFRRGMQGLAAASIASPRFPRNVHARATAYQAKQMAEVPGYAGKRPGPGEYATAIGRETLPKIISLGLAYTPGAIMSLGEAPDLLRRTLEGTRQATSSLSDAAGAIKEQTTAEGGTLDAIKSISEGLGGDKGVVSQMRALLRGLPGAAARAADAMRVTPEMAHNLGRETTQGALDAIGSTVRTAAPYAAGALGAGGLAWWLMRRRAEKKKQRQLAMQMAARRAAPRRPGGARLTLKNPGDYSIKIDDQNR